MGFLNKHKNNHQISDDDLQRTLHKNLEFTASEQYRLLRTNIKFTIPADVTCPILGVTSSIRGEGKSTTAINLAYVLAERGYKVLLIDGDLRIPSVAKKLGIDSEPGLTDMLIGSGVDIDSLQSSIHPKWYVLPSGEIPPNPSELLGSRRMERALNSLKEHFDYIVIDLPPVNLVSDAMSVAGLITGLIVVIREDYATKKDVEQCFRQIRLSNVKVLGCVMNESGANGGSYKRYGRYKKYRSYKDYRYSEYEGNTKEQSK